ncbi:MAG: leucine--tRNA ligase [Flavobacteriaceae bacterium]
MGYHFQEIEKKWQHYWAENKTFQASNTTSKPKYYILDMFPYPSGAGLHVGHPLGYIASDIYARYKRHKGYNVLHPQGYDSFGLPAEQYAIQTGQHPEVTTKTNINRYREQLDRLGFSFDWSREVRTSSPEFYRWTQWIFLQLFQSYYDKTQDKALPINELIAVFEKEGNAGVYAECAANTPKFSSEQWHAFSPEEKQRLLLDYRLTYISDTEVNWCPELRTVLANDEIVNGVSERGGHAVTKKKMKQWSMRIGAYADRLLRGLDTIDWPESLKEMQRNWIGKSLGALVRFPIENHQNHIEVFTTRPDTLYGVTFMTLAPELDLVQEITTPEQKQVVQEYIASTAQRSERDRMADVKTISGVFTGAYARHPLTQEQIPIWIGDYVLAGYGTGAVMAVPCGDQRDYAFAQHFDIPIKNIFADKDISQAAFTEKGGGVKLCNSGFLNGLEHQEAMKEVCAYLERENLGETNINYRLRDAIFSRQRYWGEPIPMYYKNGWPQPLKEENLPLVLPKVENYLPTADGAPPLGNATNWAWDVTKEKVVSNDQIDHQSVFPLEMNTMPGWAGSSWYFYRYMDPQNDKKFVSEQAAAYWRDVDLYLGGSEHATGHLLYSRFWQKFLFDLGHLPVNEYAKKLINQGMILGSSAFVYRKKGTDDYLSKGLIEGHDVEPIRVDITLVGSQDELDCEELKKQHSHFSKAHFVLEEGVYKVGREVEKMSKSKFNVVNPDQICQAYGADTLRMYEMFLGPIEQAKPWNTAGISGVHSFIKKTWKLFHRQEVFFVSDDTPSAEDFKVLHRTIKKITEDIEQFSFNTCISAFMICVNDLTAQKCHHRQILEPLVILLSPFAPHLSEELWSLLGHQGSVSQERFPLVNENYLVERTKNYPVSFNGKMRFTREFDLDLSPKEIEAIILEDAQTKKQLQGRSPKKVIVVPGKIINIVG